jgi:O-antigen ligase
VALGDVDNEYIRLIADVGILGLGLFGWFLVRIFRTASAHYGRLEAGSFHKGFAAGYLIAFTMICVHGIGATSFTSIRTMEMFMVLTGLMVCQAGRAAEWGLLPDVAPPPAPAPPLLFR